MQVGTTMETIAITVWNEVVSPLYDAACCFMVFKGEEKPVRIDVKNLSLYEKADLCRSKGVDTLICGAISNNAFTILTEREIRVISWIRGPVREIIETFNNGDDLAGLFGMPGCGRSPRTGNAGRRRKGFCGDRGGRRCSGERYRKNNKEEI
jgi:predicted Fe-Mo cluster-binding NifX family protein